MATRRSLTEREVREARLVFADALDYRRVMVVENWPWVQRIVRREVAICLGNWTLFPRTLDTRTVRDMNWLVHEMTHAWQFQRRGWIYLFEAVWAQLKLGTSAAYNYGGEEGLRSQRASGATIQNFNPEQQGAIAQHYYQLLKTGKSVEAWKPFVEDIRRSRK